MADLLTRLTERGLSLPDQIIKRNGSYVAFDTKRITRAVTRCYESLENYPLTPIEDIVAAVVNMIAAKFVERTPSVEEVQDMVESALLSAGEFEAARHYIVYREEHAKHRVIVPADVQAAFDRDKEFFPTDLQRFMFYDKYSRYNWELGRRETWVETVDRVVDYLITLSKGVLGRSVYDRIHEAIRTMRVMPSMRLLAMAGPAAERNSASIYNCSHLPVRDVDAFAEAMLISMAGCGVGYSVERENVEQFPRIKRQTGVKRPVHVVDDSTEGWAEALRYGLQTWFEGEDVEYDYSRVRPAGTPLLTKGGRASGPEPLRAVLDFCRAKLLSRQGSFLRTIDAHDMMCVTGGAAVSGGVRRTAMIAIFDYDDAEMRTCKDGTKLDANPWRWNANNSAVWPTEIDQIDLVDQMTEMYRNRRGEPGIFSRANANSSKPERRKEGMFGPNPCGEIDLRPYEFCNLSIAVARPDDTLDTLRDKVEIATIIGTIQSLATNFPGLRPDWKENCEDERLLGVDISGQQDCPVVQSAGVLEALRHEAVMTNQMYATALGIRFSAAVTCNKPNGNSSQLLNCSSGIHARWAPFYIRNVRVSPHTPLYRVLRNAGVPMHPENGQTEQNATSWVVHFPVKSPDGAKTRKDYSAVEQCEYWLLNKTHWAEHNPSVTITYQPDELLAVIAWVWEHRYVIGGMAFLPADDAQYAQMPYEEITAEEYEKAVGEFPSIDFSLLYGYEQTDMTESASTVACMSGQCEI